MGCGFRWFGAASLWLTGAAKVWLWLGISGRVVVVRAVLGSGSAWCGCGGSARWRGFDEKSGDWVVSDREGFRCCVADSGESRKMVKRCRPELQGKVLKAAPFGCTADRRPRVGHPVVLSPAVK
ncbi:hypothetical protein Droror1_Dr00025481 [Drosera rotundifolia]